MRSRWAVLLTLGVLFVAPLAQRGVASAQASEASEEAARAHYGRGVALFDEQRFDAALAEFEAAYAVSGRAAILFNIGQIHARLGHAVEAVDFLSRYRASVGEDTPPERLALVDEELAIQRARIGQVVVVVDVEGATIALDDVEVGTSPRAEPVPVSVGEHVLEARAAGHESARARFRVAGGETREVTLSLPRTGPELSPAGPPVLTVTGVTITALGLVTFAVAGALTLSEDAQLRSECSPICSVEETATIDATRVVSDVGLAVLAAGGVLSLVGALVEQASFAPRERATSFRGTSFEVWW